MYVKTHSRCLKLTNYLMMENAHITTILPITNIVTITTGKYLQQPPSFLQHRTIQPHINNIIISKYSIAPNTK